MRRVKMGGVKRQRWFWWGDGGVERAGGNEALKSKMRKKPQREKIHVRCVEFRSGAPPPTPHILYSIYITGRNRTLSLCVD